jgi:hypothetical protein
MQNGGALVVIEEVELLWCPEWAKVVTLSEFAQTFEFHVRHALGDGPQCGVLRNPDALKYSPERLRVQLQLGSQAAERVLQDSRMLGEEPAEVAHVG